SRSTPRGPPSSWSPTTRSWPPARSATCTSSMAWPPTCRWNAACPALPATKPPRPRPPPEDSAMFAYYCNLALRSFRRDRALTALMVLAIALGIGACMTTLTVSHVLSGDPSPGKSDRLFYVQLDPADSLGYTPGEEPSDQLTRLDAETLLAQKRGKRQAMMTGGGVSITPDQAGQVPFVASARYTSADFFPMFDTPMLHGNGWSAREDESHARVAVISSELNQRVFGGGNSVGRQLRIDQADFTVIGVTDQWRPTPRFYDMYSDRYGALEEVFVPFSTSRDLQMGRN